MTTTTMRAVVCRTFGPPGMLSLEQVPEPTPGRNDVVVRNHAAGINFTDLLAVEGRSQLRRVPPIIPGTEVAGEILRVGQDISRFRIGQRVLGTCVHGAYAEQTLLAEDEVYPIPDDMDFETAASFYIASTTSRYALVERARLQSGENMLVLGAGSGAGLAAIQIGKALGSRVIGAASSAEKLELALEHGADGTVLYSRDPLDIVGQKRFYSELLAASGSAKKPSPVTLGKMSSVSGAAGFDVVYDAVGGTYTEPALRSLAWEGRYLSVGFAAGVSTPSLGPLLFKNAVLMGIQPASDSARLPGRNAAAMEQMLSWFRDGLLRPKITEVYPLERAGEALQQLKDRRAKGRIVLVMT